MKTLIYSILVIFFLASCEKEKIEPEKKSSYLITSIKIWYRYDAMQLITWTFTNDTLVTFNRLDYKWLDDIHTTNPYDHQSTQVFNYKIKNDSIICTRTKPTINYRYLIKINQDSMCFIKRGNLIETYYSHKKYGSY